MPSASIPLRFICALNSSNISLLSIQKGVRAADEPSE